MATVSIGSVFDSERFLVHGGGSKSRTDTTQLPQSRPSLLADRHDPARSKTDRLLRSAKSLEELDPMRIGFPGQKRDRPKQVEFYRLKG